ncbi:MAG: EamA family transporter [Variibacter sp.]|nr:EamA family transporter [Variibacter sp.]
MLDWLWALFTLIAAAAQTLRNATQHELTAALGTAGATHVRFLFALPFALLFLIVVLLAGNAPLPHLSGVSWVWVLQGSLAQIAATALMLAAMTERSFVVVYATIKTEPVLAALFGLAFLGDMVTPPMAAAILIATTGVVVMALRPGSRLGLRAIMLGIAAGGMFALSAVGYRGAILSYGHPSFLMAATYTLLIGLVVQCVLLTAWLAWRQRAVLVAIARHWRPSLLAGFLGAFASQFWFLAFALASAASVRTLALIEVLFAQAISSLVFGQRTTRREALGIVLIVVGVAALLWAS